MWKLAIEYKFSIINKRSSNNIKQNLSNDNIMNESDLKVSKAQQGNQNRNTNTSSKILRPQIKSSQPSAKLINLRMNERDKDII